MTGPVLGPVEAHDLRYSVWVDPRDSGIGWVRIAQNLRRGAAVMLVQVLCVPSRIWLDGEADPAGITRCRFCGSPRLVARGPVQSQHTANPWQRYRCADCMGEMDMAVLVEAP